MYFLVGEVKAQHFDFRRQVNQLVNKMCNHRHVLYFHGQVLLYLEVYFNDDCLLENVTSLPINLYKGVIVSSKDSKVALQFFSWYLLQYWSASS